MWSGAKVCSFFFGALCVMSGGRLPAALFMVFLLDSKGAVSILGIKVNSRSPRRGSGVGGDGRRPGVHREAAEEAGRDKEPERYITTDLTKLELTLYILRTLFGFVVLFSGVEAPTNEAAKTLRVMAPCCRAR